MSYPLCSSGEMKTPSISTKPASTTNPDHNLWNNHGTWWCHFTIHHPNYTKERVRVSLHTRDRAEARRQRDFIMQGTSSIVSRIPQKKKSGQESLSSPTSPARFLTH